jgi:hypothetical protein
MGHQASKSMYNGTIGTMISALSVLHPRTCNTDNTVILVLF